MVSESDVYVKLAGKVSFPKSRFIRMVFRKLVTPEEGEMLLALPASITELAEKFRMEDDAVSRKLDEFVRKGVAMPLEKEGMVKHFCVNNIIQVHDATIHAAINRKYEPVQDEIVRLWKNFRETEWFEVLRQREDSGALRGGRIVPVRGAVKDTSQLLPYEDVGTIMEEAASIAVVDCPCRWLQVQEEECDKPTFTCFSFTPNAVKYIVDRGIGRKIGVDEAYEILEQCAEAGLVPMPGGAPRVRSLCNCCTDCCITLRGAVKYGYPGPKPSRFQCVVQTSECNGCQVCVMRCQFDAIEMVRMPGSKLLRAAVDAQKCMGCGACVVKCPTEALSLNLVRPAEYIPLTTGGV